MQRLHCTERELGLMSKDFYLIVRAFMSGEAEAEKAAAPK